MAPQLLLEHFLMQLMKEFALGVAGGSLGHFLKHFGKEIALEGAGGSPAFPGTVPDATH